MLDNESYKILWLAVIHNALIEATNPSKARYPTRWKREAQDWVKGGSPYFRRVCGMAEVDPDCIQKELEKRLKYEGERYKVYAPRANRPRSNTHYVLPRGNVSRTAARDNNSSRVA